MREARKVAMRSSEGIEGRDISRKKEGILGQGRSTEEKERNR